MTGAKALPKDLIDSLLTGYKNLKTWSASMICSSNWPRRFSNVTLRPKWKRILAMPLGQKF